jgi:predicted transglutaminase-like cysteine proteinase
MSLFFNLVAVVASTASVFGSVPIKVKSIKSIEVPELTLTCVSECAFLAGEAIKTSTPLNQKLDLVNNVVNQNISYRSDMEAHGVVDKWSSPAETIASKSGDCEDYAILKRSLLVNLGIKEEDMDIVVVNDERRQAFHSVLAVRNGGEVYILDNMMSEVFRHTEVENYTPLFSISSSGASIHGKKIMQNDDGADS